MINTDIIRGITFDAGGTLVRPYPSVGQIYSDVMKNHGLNHGKDVLEEAFRRSWKKAQKSSRGSIDEASEIKWWKDVVLETLSDLDKPKNFESFFNDLWNTFADARHWKLYDNARDVLAQLKDRGYRVAVLSNWDNRLRGILDGVEILDLFDQVVISTEVGCVKPDPGIFHIAQKMIGLPPRAMLHVGDSQYHDVGASRSVGWQGLLIQHHPELSHGDDEALKTLQDLLQILPDKCPS